MQDNDGIATLAQHEQRLSAALERIGKGLDRLVARPAAAAPSAAAPGPELARLREELETERTANAQLSERLKAIKERDGSARRDAEARIEAMTRQLDLQGLEMARMKKVTAQLRDSLRALTDAAVGAVPEPHLINKAMLTELEALRALRQIEANELEEVLSALAPLTAPLVEETRQDA